MTTGHSAPAGLRPDLAPPWMAPLVAAAARATPDRLSRVPTGVDGRPSAVLMLLAGDDQADSDLLVIGRAATLSSHPGQPALPGGAADPGDGGPVGTALREAVEETGLDPAGVVPLALLPALYLPVSDFLVTPVLAWWRTPSPVWAVDPGEVASVHRVPVGDLLDPANRGVVRHPSGYVGPAFEVAGLLVWGFTAGLLSRFFALAGWERPWDTTRTLTLPGGLPTPPSPPR